MIDLRSTSSVTVLQCSCVALIATSSLSSESDLRVLVCFSANTRCNIARGCVFSTSLVSLSTLSANWSVLRCWNSESVLSLLHLPPWGGDAILLWWMSKLKSLIYLLYKLYWYDDAHLNSPPLEIHNQIIKALFNLQIKSNFFGIWV